MQSTLDNLACLGLPTALTGPIARGDVYTVRRHLAALGAKAPELVDIYRTLGRVTLRVARDKGLAPKKALAEVARSLARDP